MRLLLAIATILCYHEVDPPQDAHVKVPRRSAVESVESEMLRYTVTPENFEGEIVPNSSTSIATCKPKDYPSVKPPKRLTFPEAHCKRGAFGRIGSMRVPRWSRFLTVGC